LQRRNTIGFYFNSKMYARPEAESTGLPWLVPDGTKVTAG
jgi:hypothetical protein